ncbi:MAG: TIGR02147 family protein [Oligoflexia bacterium]|nr:TIGR02147 family protein [Oligoflexia bacterium]
MKEQSFITYLEHEFIQRRKKNNYYSLRAFARHLGIEASGLSQILRGKRHLTIKMIQRLGQKLDIDPKRMSKFHELNEKDKDNNFKELIFDQFEVLSNWYYFALLELMNVKEFRNDVKWISRRLGISVTEVNLAIKKLIKLKMISIDENGHWRDLTGGKTNLGDPELTNQTFIRFQKDILNLSINALQAVPIAKREHSGVTMAIDSSKIAEAKILIKKFKRQLGKLLTGKNEDQVYQLQISLFPLSQNANNTNSTKE